MALPLLEYAPTSQNQRVAGFEIPGDEHPRLFTTDGVTDAIAIETLIQAAYRQLLNEQQLLQSNRLPFLESQLKSGQITVRDFIRALAVSEPFRDRVYETNNNYRFVRICVQRILGREVYGDREVLAWSTVLATQGILGFIDSLINSQEYLDNFGENTVPYQRRRILPQRSQGDQPFARVPRYDETHREQLYQLGYNFEGGQSGLSWDWTRQPYADGLRKVGAGIVIGGALFVGFLVGGSILDWFGWISF